MQGPVSQDRPLQATCSCIDEGTSFQSALTYSFLLSVVTWMGVRLRDDGFENRELDAFSVSVLELAVEVEARAPASFLVIVV
jgi:hypothetical protein